MVQINSLHRKVMELFEIGKYFLLIIFSIPFFYIYIQESLVILQEVVKEYEQDVKELEEIQIKLKSILEQYQGK